MNGPGRLSLRARLLVVLIAVTAAFLLIMGGVTALVLSKRLGTHFDDALISAAARTPGQIQANPRRRCRRADHPPLPASPPAADREHRDDQGTGGCHREDGHGR